MKTILKKIEVDACLIPGMDDRIERIDFQTHEFESWGRFLGKDGPFFTCILASSGTFRHSPRLYQGDEQ